MSPNEPEPLAPPYEDGDPEIGAALRDFFLGLLQGTHLAQYHRDRDSYIEEHVSHPDAADLLRSDAFVDIERHILAVTGSARAKPLWMISPPY